EVLRALCRIVTESYKRALESGECCPIARFQEPRLVNQATNDFRFLTPVSNPRSGDLAAFNCVLDGLKARSRPFIYTVEPKEYSQNLSDASARESVRNYTLTLAAAIPNLGAKGSASYDYLKRSQYLLETIK